MLLLAAFAAVAGKRPVTATVAEPAQTVYMSDDHSSPVHCAQQAGRLDAPEGVYLCAIRGACCPAVSARPQRELKQVEFFYNTPAAAGSTSVDVNGGLAVSREPAAQPG